jgi:acyl-CoA synthetase (AMP-forming)/AMP-acid ligase II
LHRFEHALHHSEATAHIGQGLDVSAPEQRLVRRRAAAQPDDKEVIAFCRERLARFKVPKTLVYGALPKTSTGKIQKFALREQAGSL